MMQDAVTKCLNYADSYGFTSLSLPAVGTGHLKKDAKQSAQIMYSCVKEYRKKNEKSLKLIRIVIMQEKVFEDFKKAFGRKDPTLSTNSTGNTKDYACQTFFSPKLQSNSRISVPRLQAGCCGICKITVTCGNTRKII